MGWTLDAGGAQSAIDNTKTEWADLDGHEGKIQTAMSTCAEAALEDEIFNALNNLHDNAINPLTVTMIRSGYSAVNAAQDVVNTLKDSNDEMTSDAKSAVEDAIRGANQTPDYKPGDSTATTPVLTSQNPGKYQV
ncbi:hypothetical protein GCM10027591_01390 [Zhihengliuella somnathii]